MCSGEIQWVAFGGDVELGKGHEEEAAECGSKKSAVDGLESAIRGRVDVQAGGAEELNGFLARYVIATDGEDTSLIAEDAWTGSKVLELVFVCHLLYAGPRRYVTLVNETVEELCAAFYLCDVVGDFHVPTFSASSVRNTIAVLISHLNVVVFVLLLIILLLFLLFFLLVFFWFHIQYHFQCFFVHWDLILQASEIEVVLDEIFRNFGEVFVAEEAAEG